jgi:putative glycosyltransferase
MDAPLLSIVTTIYNSAATVEEFVRRSVAAAEAITSDFEIVVVDDGSPDDSLSIVLALLTSEPRLKVVELSRNFGHHRALMTGLLNASGTCCFLIDSDLEEPPELLTEFWRTLHASDIDVVYGFQRERAGNLSRRVLGRWAWGIFQALIPYRIPRNHVTARLMKRAYVDALVRHTEQHTVIGGLWVITGFRQVGVAVARTTRAEVTYSFFHRWRSLIETITSFSELPLIGIFYLGMGISVLSAAAAIALVTLRLLGKIGLAGWASVMVSLWLIGGMLIFCVGIIGIYVSRIFIETKHRPYTIVRNIHGGTAGGSAS